MSSFSPLGKQSLIRKPPVLRNPRKQYQVHHCQRMRVAAMKRERSPTKKEATRKEAIRRTLRKNRLMRTLSWKNQALLRRIMQSMLK